MTTVASARSEILERLHGSYAGKECAWERFYQPKFERANFATRYHLVYPALACLLTFATWLVVFAS